GEQETEKPSMDYNVATEALNIVDEIRKIENGEQETEKPSMDYNVATEALNIVDEIRKIENREKEEKPGIDYNVATETLDIVKEIREIEEHDHDDEDHEHDEHEHHHHHEHDDHDHDHCESCSHEHHHHHGHDHVHGHEHGEGEEGSRKVMFIRLAVSAILWAVGVFRLTGQWQTIALATAYMIIGYDIVMEAGEGLVHFDWTNEEFLMAVASVTAFFIGEAEEAVMVMWLYQLGELLTDMAVDHSKDNIENLMMKSPDTVHLMDGDQITELETDKVREGMLLQIRPFEEIPVDGVVKEGNSVLDMSSINGESMPVAVSEGTEVISGSVNTSSVLVIEASRSLEDSTVSKIRELVENCRMEKSRTESIVDRFTRFYTPAVIILAIAIAVFAPMVSSLSYQESVRMACTLLVISCPCALVISVPLAFFCGVGSASRRGVLVKGAEHLEALDQFDYLGLDKTGTLTSGEFIIEEINSKMEDEDFLKLCASIERISNHPLARAIVRRYGEDKEYSIVSGFEEVPGKGVKATIGARTYCLGNYKFTSEYCSEEFEEINKTAVYCVTEEEKVGHIIFADEIKRDAKDTLRRLKAGGVNRVAVLSGDRQGKVDEMKKLDGIDDVHGDLMPADKVELIRQAKESGHKVAFVGDGTNDAAVLTMADVGIAMGTRGTDTAIASSDVVIMNDSLSGLAEGRKLAHRTISIVKQNIWFIVLCKLGFIVLGVMQMIPMWAAVFADVGVTLITVLNSVRLLRQ
ncbi:MAG: cadmium-translocating P-type ATPase, partial [Erysipelotrichaceae bacterium]|nr:cadmium-translocating P-type ATPase [Erysipelotrichaceae bacterium]